MPPDASAVTKKQEINQIVKSLQAIARWVANINEPLPEQAEDAINTILRTYSKRSQIMMVALTQYHISKLVQWLEEADAAEEALNLYIEKHGGTDALPPDELRKTIELHHKRVKDAIDLIERFIEKMPNVPRSVGEEDEKVRLEHEGETVFDSPSKREKIKKLLASIGREDEEQSNG